MSTVQGHEHSPGQAPQVEPPRQVRLTRKMREAIEALRDAVGTDKESYAKKVAQRALSGDQENWYGAKRNRLLRGRRRASLASASRRVNRGLTLRGGGGARPRKELRALDA